MPTPRTKKTLQVFVSHTGADAALAHRLAGDLAAAGMSSWIAPDSIRPGEGWVDAINRGLEESGVVVVLLTPRAVDSMWVRQEVSAAIALERQGRIRLIPLQVEPCDVPPLWEAYQKISLSPDYQAGASQLRAALTQAPRRAQNSRKRPRAVRTGSTAVIDASVAELNAYARLYDALFPRLPSEDRNYILNAVVVDQVFQIGSATRFTPDVINSLYGKGSDGDRMVALLVLQTAPATTCLDAAVDAIERPRSPFEQYHGLRSVDLMTHMLSPVERQAVSRVLTRARGKYLIPANLSRWEVYQEIARKLAARQSKAAARAKRIRRAQE